MTRSYLLSALVLAGCAADATDESEITSYEIIPPTEDCDPLNCPGNSDLAGVLGIYELDATGTEWSSRGWRISSVEHPNIPWVSSLFVEGPSLFAGTPANSYTDATLEGLKITLDYFPAGAHTKKQYELVIETYMGSNVSYYTNGGSASQIDGYYIYYTEVGTGTRKDLCGYADMVDHGVSGSWAVFWEGDRIEPITGKIIASNAGVGNWFNISCAGEATIKGNRARATGAVKPGTPVAQRQATLNMFMAAYCGPEGEHYTQLGQRIDWSDLSGPKQMNPLRHIEAIWNEHGAVCLNKPRKVARADVACVASLPYCSEEQIANWSLYGWLISGTPIFSPLPISPP